MEWSVRAGASLSPSQAHRSGASTVFWFRVSVVGCKQSTRTNEYTDAFARTGIQIKHFGTENNHTRKYNMRM